MIQNLTIRSQGIELTRNTMRAAVLSAESTRVSIAALRTRGAFDESAILREVKGKRDFAPPT